MAPRNSAGQAAKPPSQSAAADRLQSREVAKNWELSLCGSASLREKKKNVFGSQSRQASPPRRKARSNFSNNERKAPLTCRNFREKQIGCNFEGF